MSHEGKMRRGEFYSNKNPKAENLKADVAYFLEQSKPKEEPEVEETEEEVEETEEEVEETEEEEKEDGSD